MDCCTTEAPAAGAIVDCPGCGQRGRRVKSVTLDALLREGTERTGEAYRFCSTTGCEVAWFGEATGHRILAAASRVRIGQKETEADRPLCYCFGFTAADVIGDVQVTGTSEIPTLIKERCRRGDDRCPETNPQGSCCLGNVHAALIQVLR